MRCLLIVAVVAFGLTFLLSTASARGRGSKHHVHHYKAHHAKHHHAHRAGI